MKRVILILMFIFLVSSLAFCADRSPGFYLGQGKAIGLTDSQAKQLKAIRTTLKAAKDKARKDAGAVITSSQKGKIAQMEKDRAAKRKAKKAARKKK